MLSKLIIIAIKYLSLQKKRVGMIAESLLRYMNEMLRQTPLSFYRYAYDTFPWQSQLSGLVGPRGVGKSTMLRQYILQHKNDDKFLETV